MLSLLSGTLSGSPVIQNGKQIGAITYVLADDPTIGCAIFTENMLETAQGVTNASKEKEASKQKNLENGE